MEIMTTRLPVKLPEALQHALMKNVQDALAEDIHAGDLTALLIPADETASATIISRENAIICGTPWTEACFLKIDPSLKITWLVDEGAMVSPDQTLCHLQGNARAILTAERAALNFLQTLSATATITRTYANAIQGTGAAVLDTRKTIPGLRDAQKYAVRIGGGQNQRLGLYDGILIKENHIAAAGGIPQALSAAKALGQSVSIQIEVETLDEFLQALNAGATSILLDNFDLPALQAAVQINQGRALLEASGNITLTNIRDVARTGVDRISIGSLTKHIKAVDLSLRFNP
jgi:nicotinate-nucleotide pyrophosphorylase (carboxylating)